MKAKKLIHKLESYGIYIFLSLYAWVSYLSLALFPLTHSDEPWLAGLTNAFMSNRSFLVTEPFFDLMPRTVHTMKALYHLLQMPLILIFGYNIISVRLVSLIAALISLYLFYRLLVHMDHSKTNALLFTIFLSMNLQFVYASHFARQEMLLFFILILAYYMYYKHPLKTYGPALLIGLAIAIHPNAFILAVMMGLIILWDTIEGSKSIRLLITYVLILLGFALIHVAVSFIANPNVFQEYLAYGKTFGVDAVPLSRLENFKDFYLKLYYQITGTYYIPPMKSYYLLSLLLWLLTAIRLVFNKLRHKNITTSPHLAHPFLMALGFNFGVFIIGRYNTTSILFLLFPLSLLWVKWLSDLQCMDLNLSIKKRKVIPSLLFFMALCLIGLTSFTSLRREVMAISSQDYESYLEEIEPYIKKDSIVLGNLSSGFVFKDTPFYDLRNLDFLNDMSIETYINARHINTVIYYEEYDYIQRNPSWQILYGDHFNPMELKEYLTEHGTILHSFDSVYYGNRIIRYIDGYPWKVTIYRISP